ncbi:MAG: ABC transporter substrate-binding protein, partial [Alphaproteobacteria bacterium]
RFTRRQFMAGSAGTAAGAALASSLAKPAIAKDEGIKIGFCVDLTGDAAAWGLPGLYGVEIWLEEVNGRGGINVGGKKLPVEVIPYDDQFDVTKTMIGVKKLLFEDEVDFMILLGGPPAQAPQDILTRAEMLSTTLAPSDMAPDTPYLISPVETHPLYNVTGVEWVKKAYPGLKTMAVITQNDEIGLASLATYRAAAEVAGIEIIDEKLFGFETIDFAPVVAPVLAKQPDILCWDTAYPDYVNLLTEQAFLQNYQGQFVSCTFDGYDLIIEKSSKEFMEGAVWQFCDFDDPMLFGSEINFENPAAFYRTYQERFPGAWNAVSWEYAAICEMWKDAIEVGGSYEPMAVFKQLKSFDPVPHVFGEAKWWGTEIFGVDNAVVGNWPVVQMQNGKAVIVEMADNLTWLDAHLDVLIRHYKDLQVI